MSDVRLTSGVHEPRLDKVPNDWRVLRLMDFCAFSQGGRLGLTKQDSYRSSGFPAFSAAGQDGFVEVAEFKNTDAVVLSAIGANCGRCFIAHGDWTLLANVQAIIPEKSSADARFLFYRVNRDDYWPRSGSAQPFIKPSDMKSCWVSLPPLAQQGLIADVLGALDTTIRETEAIIAKLKAVKQGLLHDLLTRGIDANGELRPPQAEAPHLYKQSPLGWIPKEWDAPPLSALTGQLITYGIVQAGHHVPGGIPYIRTGDMAGDSLVREGMLCTSKRIANSYGRSEIRAGEIVIAIRATVGKVLSVPSNLDGANLTQGTARISPRKGIHNNYLLWAIRQRRVQQWISAEMKGTTFFEITLKDLRNVPIPTPPSIDEQSAIASRLESAELSIQRENKYREGLMKCRKGLMDDLLTGRVRVAPLLTAKEP